MYIRTGQTLLYPTSRQYPVDEVCEKIVRALEKRHWEIPGIQVTFENFIVSTSQTSCLTTRYVSKIEGTDFKLWFCRIQKQPNEYPNIAALRDIIIPKKELQVEEDETGPYYRTYVGDNWEADKASFMQPYKYREISKPLPLEKKQIEYRGHATGSDHFLGYAPSPHGRYSPSPPGRNTYLLADPLQDLKGEPGCFYTENVMQEFKAWLHANVLQKIEPVKKTTP